MLPKETFGEQRSITVRGEPSWMHAGRSVREQVHYICESEHLSGHQREMSFLRHLMLYGNTGECDELEGKITQAQSKERSARRAVWLMAVLTASAVVGLGYSAILLEDFPQNKTQLVMRIFYALGLASLVSLLAFAGFWLVALGELNEQREKCRRLVTRIVESRLGRPATVSSPEMVGRKSSRSRMAADPGQVANGEIG